MKGKKLKTKIKVKKEIERNVKKINAVKKYKNTRKRNNLS